MAALHGTWKTAFIWHLPPAVPALHFSASNRCRGWFMRSAARCFAEGKQIHEKVIGEPSCSHLEEVICEENQHDLPQPSYCSLAACPLWHHTMGSHSVKCPPCCLEALQESPHTSGHSESRLGRQGGPTARRGGLTSQGPAPQYPRRDSPAVAKPS